MKTYKLLLEILTPVHIGDGTYIEPYEYVIDDLFYKIDLSKFLLKLSKKEKHFRNKDCVIFTSNVSEDIKNFYKGKIDDPHNQLLIHPFIRDGNRSPYIPGSSVKGSIRTALIFDLFDKRYIGKNKFRSDILEANLLKCERGWMDSRGNVSVTKGLNPQKDPFRGVKTVDILLSPNSTKIHKIETVIKKENIQPMDIQLIKETTHSEFTGNPLSAQTEIRIDDELFDKNKEIKEKISIEDIISSCKEFSGQIIDNELGRYFRRHQASNIYGRLKDIWSGLQENEFMFRLGQGSGYDSMTMNLKLFSKNIKTRKLTDEIIPLGWIKGKFEVEIEGLKFKKRTNKEEQKRKPKREISTIKTEVQEWEGVDLTLTPGSGVLTVSWKDKKASVEREKANNIREKLPESLRNRLKKKRKLENVNVSVEAVGNAFLLLEVRSS